MHPPAVHVGPGLDVVERVCDPVQRLEEVVVEDVLCVPADPQLHGGVVGGGVHRLHGGYSGHGLVLLDVPATEQELPVQVRSRKITVFFRRFLQEENLRSAGIKTGNN